MQYLILLDAFLRVWPIYSFIVTLEKWQVIVSPIWEIAYTNQTGWIFRQSFGNVLLLCSKIHNDRCIFMDSMLSNYIWEHFAKYVAFYERKHLKFQREILS